MKIKLTITAGPHTGKEFDFEGRDTFLVGRTNECDFQLSFDDPYFSRRHFVLEISPPRCRLLDLGSRNGTFVNGTRVQTAELKNGDEISVGHSRFKVSVTLPVSEEPQTLDLPRGETTIDYQPIPGYRMEQELGRGGMGIVYRAICEKDGQAVALKIITPAKGTSPRQIKKFKRECGILAELQHPNIVGFRDVGEEGDVLFLAMELVDGPDLGVWLKTQALDDIKDPVRIICQMLGGLAHAHSRGFVHRDIKPANILIARDGEKRIAKLADFGLARVFEESKLSGLTLQGETGGTPAFMAPEQVTHYRQVLPSADQYSAAATLYKLITDHYTHDFPKELGAQLAHLVTAKIIPITDRRTDIPLGLAVAIHTALQQEPENRYPDVLCFRKELLRFA